MRGNLFEIKRFMQILSTSYFNDSEFLIVVTIHLLYLKISNQKKNQDISFKLYVPTKKN